MLAYRRVGSSRTAEGCPPARTSAAVPARPAAHTWHTVRYGISPFFLSCRQCCGSESGSISQRHGYAEPDPDPDPNQNVMDPQHCLHPIMFLIIYTAHPIEQCSESGSVSCWAFQIRIRICNYLYGSESFIRNNMQNKKNLDFYSFVTF